MALGTPSRDFCQKSIGNLENKMLCLAQGIEKMFSTVTQDVSNLFTFAQGIHCGHGILTSLSKNNTLSSYSMGIKKTWAPSLKIRFYYKESAGVRAGL